MFRKTRQSLAALFVVVTAAASAPAQVPLDYSLSGSMPAGTGPTGAATGGGGAGLAPTPKWYATADTETIRMKSPNTDRSFIGRSCHGLDGAARRRARRQNECR